MREKITYLTHKDLERKARYEQAEPKQMGNLHERMKYLVEVSGLHEPHNDVWQAIHDLQLELSFYEVDPGVPYGHRCMTMVRRDGQEKQAKA